MRRQIFGLIIVFLLFGTSLFAADGDLIVNGKVGIGTTPNTALSAAGTVTVDFSSANTGTAANFLQF